MKIIVSVKQVPARDSTLRINSQGKWLDESEKAALHRAFDDEIAALDKELAR